MADIPTEQADKVIAILMICMEREGIGGRIYPVRTSDKRTSGIHVVFTDNGEGDGSEQQSEA